MTTKNFEGRIYILTSPSNKSYVGQTVQDVNLRWRQHELDALNNRDHCKALCNAIRLYGMENFTKNVLITYNCETKEELREILDQSEQDTIELMDTLHPRGYNMHTGGSFNGAGTVYTEEIRDNFSNSKRKAKIEDYDLPRNVLYIKNDKHEGFRLNIQNKPRYMFVDHNLSLDQKYNLVMEKYHQVLNNTDVGRKTHPYTNIPKYINYEEKRDSFRVKKPGFPRKAFGNKLHTSDENLQLAIEYLNSLE